MTRARKQVPKRAYSLEELRLNNIEAERLLSPTDNTLSSVRTRLQVCAPHLDGMAAWSLWCICHAPDHYLSIRLKAAGPCMASFLVFLSLGASSGEHLGYSFTTLRE